LGLSLLAGSTPILSEGSPHLFADEKPNFLVLKIPTENCMQDHPKARHWFLTIYFMFKKKKWGLTGLGLCSFDPWNDPGRSSTHQKMKLFVMC
jgi:hypothetical protein